MSEGSESGVVYWLWEQEQDVERSISRLSDNIADLEREITEARRKRDELRLVVVEMHAARGIIERAGLKVERVAGQVQVSVDPEFAAAPPSKGEPT